MPARVLAMALCLCLSVLSVCKAVLTNGHTGHVPRASRFFFFLRDPNWLWWNNFLKLIIFLPSERSTVRETRLILTSEGPVRLGVSRAPMQEKTLLSVCQCLCLCLPHVGFLSKRFLAWEILSTYPTLCYKEIRVTSKIRALSSGTLLQTLDLENFATAYRSSKRAINLAGERWTLTAW